MLYEKSGTKVCAFCFKTIATGGTLAPITHKWFCSREHYVEWLREQQEERIEKNRQRIARAQQRAR